MKRENLTGDVSQVDLVLRAVGPATEGGRLPLAELARLASGLQMSIERLAWNIVGGSDRSGRRPQEIVDAVRLDFVGFQEGSALLQIARAGQLALGEDLLEQSLDALAAGVESIRARSGARPQHFSPQVVNGLRTLAGGIGSSNVTKIELADSGRVRFVIDRDLQAALRQITFDAVEEVATVVGRLHMGDFSPASLRCRIDTYAGSVLCDFDSDLRGAVLDAMDQLVMAQGRAELDPNGSHIHILHIVDLHQVASAGVRSLDSLAREQGVRPLGSASELRGEPIDDFDEFLAAIESARGGNP
ncbi:MAG TPA: hypothetical protein VFM55_07540 [Micromonosporaceae bacterium]|nr:hypothetical protein [Micromonosporaceae bacterium]